MKPIFNASVDRLKQPKRSCVVVLLCAATTIALPAQPFTTLLSFDGTNGSEPLAVLVQGTDGNLYGTTAFGGAHNRGTVFKITPSGTLTTLHSFCSRSQCADGAEPRAGLVLATDGSFYGTTQLGGANSQCLLGADAPGCGTVFKITPSGTLTTLYSFCSASGCTDGSGIVAALVQAADGNFYGTTHSGGASLFPSGGAGTVFEITPSGTLTTLHTFCSLTECADGYYPNGLVQGTDGNFYGTTGQGGASSGAGTVFKITPSGTLTTLYSFCSQGGRRCADGQTPLAPLVEASNGDLYGTTQVGGASSLCPSKEGCGTVFKITPSGKFTTLYSFCAQNGCPDGEDPLSALVQGTDGNLYGTTEAGGSPSLCPILNVIPTGCGTVFEITTSGTLATLYAFCSQTGCADGYYPYAALAQVTNGEFYGMTNVGGSSAASAGTVFSVSVGLGPFVKAVPHNGQVGQVIRILGTALIGTTAVTFNGIPAAFTIDAPTEITATVPDGATTGTVQVTTPTGALRSAGPFTVLP